MKRILLSLLSITLCLSFSGCSKEIKEIFVKSANKISNTLADKVREAEGFAQDAGETVSEIKESFSEIGEAEQKVITDSQLEALNKAKSWLDMDCGFSKTNLISQLSLHGFSHDDATFAAEHCDADWNQEAEETAKRLLHSHYYSRMGLIRQLKDYEGYTYAEACYGADHSDADWYALALNTAKEYLKFYGLSQKGLVQNLQIARFSIGQIEYAVENCDADWFEQASMAAKRNMLNFEYSKEELIEQLESEGFSLEEATYGVEHNGFKIY